MKKTIMIEGMSCHHCTMAVENALKGLNEVLKVEVSLEEKRRRRLQSSKNKLKVVIFCDE